MRNNSGKEWKLFSRCRCREVVPPVQVRISGQGLWTKVKQMTAYCLSAVQCNGADGLLEKVRVIQADTLSMVQGGWTAGSTTSEASCEAVRLCCNILVERLAPLMEKLKEQMDSVKWKILIMQATSQSVHLSTNAYFVPEFTAMRYINYVAAISEAEITILTGETKMLQTDLIYDYGKSLNPAVDFGQIEGAFVQGIDFFMLEEYLTNSDGLMVADGTWTYKIPTIDTIPKQLNVQIVNSGPHKKRVLSSKASGEPPLLLSSLFIVQLEPPLRKRESNCVFGRVRKIVAAESAYEAKKTKEVAIMECKELEFLLIDTDELPGPHGVPFLLNLPCTTSSHRVSGELYSVTDEGLKQLDVLEGVTLGHYERLPVGLRQVGGGGKGVVVMAEAYYGHRSFAQEMWRRSGEVGFQCFDREVEKGYVRRDLRPKDRSFREMIEFVEEATEVAMWSE
ncbi:abscisic aldehyde oxidase 3 [Tanacetum coccineum]